LATKEKRPKVKRPRESISKKKAADINTDEAFRRLRRRDEEDDNEDDEFALPTESAPIVDIPILRTPSNLQPVLRSILDEFWNESLEPLVAIPFFSLITRENCASFGLPDYFSKVEESCTLTNIKVIESLFIDTYCIYC